MEKSKKQTNLAEGKVLLSTTAKPLSLSDIAFITVIAIVVLGPLILAVKWAFE